jgi:hypothetical protein
MGKKLNEFWIEEAIAKNPNTQFETCCFCGGIEEGMVMHEVDYETFDVMCDECKDMKDSFDAWVDDNVIKFADGYGTQDAQFKNRIVSEKDLFIYFVKEFGS